MDSSGEMELLAWPSRTNAPPFVTHYSLGKLDISNEKIQRDTAFLA